MRKASRRFLPGALLLCLGVVIALGAEEPRKVTLHLKNGDQLTGEVLSEDSDRIVLSTPWNVAIFVPKSEVERQIVVAPPVEPGSPDSGASNAETAGIATQAATAAPDAQPVSIDKAPAASLTKAKKPQVNSTRAKRPQNWKWNLKLGTDVTKGARDRTIYFGQTSLTYTRNYDQNPKRFLRNKMEYRVDYGETDGQVSANRMVGANKMDFDIGSGFYGYAALGAGYDKVRKIDYQYELGPGIGYHLVAEKSIVLDVELGLNYQYRKGLNSAPNREVIQSRVGQELTWEVVPKITFSEQVSLLPFLDDLGEYQVRLQGNLGFGIVRHLSLNLTVLNFYDTLPAPGVPNNELQFRSSLGVTF